jgi:hypothetical protein
MLVPRTGIEPVTRGFSGMAPHLSPYIRWLLPTARPLPVRGTQPEEPQNIALLVLT